MYLILFDANNKARCIVPNAVSTKDDIYLFESLPPYTPQEGYATSLHLTNQGTLEWQFTPLPQTPPYEPDAEREDYEAALAVLGMSVDGWTKKADLEAKTEALRAKIETAATFADDDTALEMVELFPRWAVGLSVHEGDRLQDGGVLWKAAEDHITTDANRPGTGSEWAPVVTAWPEWVQPESLEDAYMSKDQVSHTSKRWVSTVDDNMSEPGVNTDWEEHE